MWLRNDLRLRSCFSCVTNTRPLQDIINRTFLISIPFQCQSKNGCSCFVHKYGQCAHDCMHERTCVHFSVLKHKSVPLTVPSCVMRRQACSHQHTVDYWWAWTDCGHLVSISYDGGAELGCLIKSKVIFKEKTHICAVKTGRCPPDESFHYGCLMLNMFLSSWQSPSAYCTAAGQSCRNKKGARLFWTL